MKDHGERFELLAEAAAERWTQRQARAAVNRGGAGADEAGRSGKPCRSSTSRRQGLPA